MPRSLLQGDLNTLLTEIQILGFTYDIKGVNIQIKGVSEEGVKFLYNGHLPHGAGAKAYSLGKLDTVLRKFGLLDENS